MKNQTFVGVFAFFFLSVAAPKSQIIGKEYELIGSWRGESLEENGSLRSVGEITLSADGTARGVAQVLRKTPDGSFVSTECVEFVASWKISGNIVEYIDTRYSNGINVASMKDRVIKITQNSVEYEDLSDGQIYSRNRISSLTLTCS